MAINSHYDKTNIFAQIIRREMPASRIFEDDNVLVIMDVFPQSRGHCLVIPKAPSRNLLEAHAKDVGRIFGTAQRISKAVRAALDPDGIVITQLNGPAAGQTVFHTHVHIIPRYEGQTEAPHASGEMADMSELNQLAAKIRAAL